MTRFSACAALAVAGLLTAAMPLFAQTDTTSIRAIAERRLRVEQAVQNTQQAWSTERSEMQALCGALEGHIAYLRGRQSSDAETLAALEREVREMQREFAESKRLEDSLHVTVDSLYNILERSVENSLPFRIEERRARLSDLKASLALTDTEPADKLRKLLDAFQLEATYGMTTDVIEQELTVGGETVVADVLRIGRLSLFWRSVDGKRVGRYDRAASRWVELPGKYNGTVGRAIEMVSHERPVEVLSLPLGEAQP